MMMRTSRMLAYLWAAPATALGFLFALIALRGGQAAIVHGVLEVHGPLVQWYAAASLWALMRGGDFYLDNVFEQAAANEGVGLEEHFVHALVISAGS